MAALFRAYCTPCGMMSHLPPDEPGQSPWRATEAEADRDAIEHAEEAHRGDRGFAHVGRALIDMPALADGPFTCANCHQPVPNTDGHSVGARLLTCER